jgi:hypothetical protein
MTSNFYMNSSSFSIIFAMVSTKFYKFRRVFSIFDFENRNFDKHFLSTKTQENPGGYTSPGSYFLKICAQY